MSPDDVDKAAGKAFIDDYENLFVRQVTIHQYRVFHAKADGSTHYLVDLFEGTCNCPDSQMNRGDTECCPHLAVALYEGRQRMDVGDVLTYDLSNVVRDARDSLDSLRRLQTGLEADRAHRDAQRVEESQDDAARQATDDPVGALMDILDNQGIDTDHVEAWIDDQYGSLQFESDNMSDEDFQTYREWCQSTDGVNWDGNNYRNFIKKADFEAVLS